jgi:hypothetical protein
MSKWNVEKPRLRDTVALTILDDNMDPSLLLGISEKSYLFFQTGFRFSITARRPS